jgi:hypothetical protein
LIVVIFYRIIHQPEAARSSIMVGKRVDGLLMAVVDPAVTHIIIE